MNSPVKLKTNLLVQNCYVLPMRESLDEHKDYLQKEYLAHDFVTEGGAMRDKYHVESYPYTPESVASHMPDCDYKLDPQRAVNESVPRGMYGDMTGAAEVLQMDKSDIDAFFARVDDLRKQAAENQIKKDVENKKEEEKK